MPTFLERDLLSLRDTPVDGRNYSFEELRQRSNLGFLEKAKEAAKNPLTLAATAASVVFLAPIFTAASPVPVAALFVTVPPFIVWSGLMTWNSADGHESSDPRYGSYKHLVDIQSNGNENDRRAFNIVNSNIVQNQLNNVLSGDDNIVNRLNLSLAMVKRVSRKIWDGFAVDRDEEVSKALGAFVINEMEGDIMEDGRLSYNVASWMDRYKYELRSIMDRQIDAAISDVRDNGEEEVKEEGDVRDRGIRLRSFRRFEGEGHQLGDIERNR